MHEPVVWLDLMHRLDLGQAPYADFHSPLGWLAMWLLHAGQLLQGGFAGAPEAADWLMLCAVLPLATVVLAGRAPIGAAIFVLIALLGMVAAPWRIGFSGWHSDPGLHYNHWGWALLTVLMLLWLPGPASRRRAAVDALAVGALLSLLFFTKLTHFAAGLAFVALFGVPRRDSRASALAGTALFAGCVLCVQAAGGWVDDYLQENLRILEVVRSAQLEDGNFRPITLGRIWHEAHGGIALLILCCAAAWFTGSLNGTLALHALFAAAACAAVMLQDTSKPELMFPLTAFLTRLAATAPAQSPARNLALIGMALHLLPMLSKQVLASGVFGFVASGGMPAFATDLPRLEGVWVGGPSKAINAFADEDGMAAWRSAGDAFRWARANPQQSGDELSHGEYLDTLRSGLSLLRDAGVSGPVAVVDAINPFPALLGADPPNGVLIAIHINRQAGRETLADPNMVFGDALWLMAPKYPFMADANRLIREVQAERLANDWTPAAENEHWRLMRRKPPAEHQQEDA